MLPEKKKTNKAEECKFSSFQSRSYLVNVFSTMTAAITERKRASAK